MEDTKITKIANEEGIDISHKLEWFQKIKGRVPDEIIKQFIEIDNKKDALSSLLRTWTAVVDHGDKYLNTLGDLIEKHETGVEGYDKIHDIVVGRYIDDLRDINAWRKDLKDNMNVKEGDLWCEGMLRYRIEETGRAVEKLMDMLEAHYGDKIIWGKIGEFFEYKEYYKRRNEMVGEMERKSRDNYIKLMKGIIKWPDGPIIGGLPMKKFISDDGSGHGSGRMIFGILRKGDIGYIVWKRVEGTSIDTSVDSDFEKIAEYESFESMYDDGWKVD